ERYLFIAAAACVDLFGKRADLFAKLADDQRVHVFIACRLSRSPFEERGLLCFFCELIERRNEASTLVGREDADLLQSACKGLRAANIGLNQALIEMQGSGKAFEYLRWPFLKASAPQFHRSGSFVHLLLLAPGFLKRSLHLDRQADQIDE